MAKLGDIVYKIEFLKRLRSIKNDKIILKKLNLIV